MSKRPRNGRFFMFYPAYKQFCERASDEFGNRLPSNLNETEIREWEEAINKLRWLEV